jgi:hypothetical protein
MLVPDKKAGSVPVGVVDVRNTITALYDTIPVS